MSQYTMKTSQATLAVQAGRAPIDHIRPQDKPPAVVSLAVGAHGRSLGHFDLEPVEARAHAQHLLACADEVERLRKREQEGT